MSFLLIEDAQIHAGPVASVLAGGGRVLRIGAVDRRAVESLGVPVEHIDGRGCVLWPGFIDVHEHLAGGSGESGWGTQTPEIGVAEIVESGITTVVGCLGTDTTTKTMPSLLARAKALKQAGLTAYVWTGGYDVPPVTLTGSIRSDILFVDEIIGAGETAIADRRSSAPTVAELARVVKNVHVAGSLAGKAGVTHFHVGEEDRRLADCRDLLNDWAIEPEWIYPTHVERNEALMREAAEMTHGGVTVDVDVIEHDLAKWVRFFLQAGGDPAFLTASSDAAISSPTTLFEQVRSCILDEGLDPDLILRMVTSNPARMLHLADKARIAEGADADIVVLDQRSLDIKHVIAQGKVMLRDGVPVATEAYLSGSNRRITLHGTET